MDFIDYYKILGISKNATAKQIKSAYRKLARKYHPDVNPGDNSVEKKFKEINEANEVLSDSEKRKKYDKYGKDWKHADQFEEQERQQQQYGGGFGNRRSGGFSGSDFSGSGFEGEDFSSFFNSMFGGAAGGSGFGGRSATMKGQDFTAELHLPLRQAATTHKQTLTVNGKKIRITIPAGIRDGQTIRIKGQGGQGQQGGPKGDLLITFKLDKDKDFERKGDNLYTQSKVDLYSLILGGETEINTLHGKVKIKIKQGTNPGSKIRLKNKGFPVYKNAHMHGDLYITLNVELPKELTPKEKELFEQLKKLRK